VPEEEEEAKQAAVEGKGLADGGTTPAIEPHTLGKRDSASASGRARPGAAFGAAKVKELQNCICVCNIGCRVVYSRSECQHGVWADHQYHSLVIGTIIKIT